MHVVHRDGARIALGDRVLQRFCTNEEKYQSKAARIAGASGQTTSLQARVNNVHWPSRNDAFSDIIRRGSPPHRITLTQC
jgi:hypothetical protein